MKPLLRNSIDNELGRHRVENDTTLGSSRTGAGRGSSVVIRAHCDGFFWRGEPMTHQARRCYVSAQSSHRIVGRHGASLRNQYR